MRALATRLLAPLVLLSLLACNTTDPRGSALIIEITNLDTEVPSFGWLNQGAMNSVQVTTDADRNTVLWRIQSTADDLVGPIPYGTQGPAGTTTTGSSPALQRGVIYRVSIRTLTGFGGSGTFSLR